MENVISKMGLYDLFVRGVTGLTILCAADLFGIANVLGGSIPVWVIILGGYICGLVLEELSWIMEKVFHSRSRIENKVCAEEKYSKYDYEKCKDALRSHDKEIVADEPLAHIIMSASFKIAFTFFVILEILDTVCCNDIISDSFICPVVDVVILIVLILVFHFRGSHYCERRAKNIFDYCIGKGYTNIEKAPGKDNKNEA